MKGWNGKILRVYLSKGTSKITSYSEDIAKRFIGGRGLAVKLLWDELPKGADPLGPENMLIFAAGPYTAYSVPNSGKMVVAAKSPLTGGYGDGNLGTRAAVNMRKCGLDAVVVTGKSEKPVGSEEDRSLLITASRFFRIRAMWILATTSPESR